MRKEIRPDNGREKELAALIAATKAQRYKYTLSQIADGLDLVVLMDNNDVCLYRNNDTDYISIWPKIIYESKLFESWDYAVLKPISLKFFVENVLGPLSEKQCLVNVFPLIDGDYSHGMVVNIDEFIEDLW